MKCLTFVLIRHCALTANPKDNYNADQMTLARSVATIVNRIKFTFSRIAQLYIHSPRKWPAFSTYCGESMTSVVSSKPINSFRITCYSHRHIRLRTQLLSQLVQPKQPTICHNCQISSAGQLTMTWNLIFQNQRNDTWPVGCHCSVACVVANHWQSNFIQTAWSTHWLVFLGSSMLTILSKRWVIFLKTTQKRWSV